MTPQEIKNIRHDYGLSVNEFADMTGTACGRTVRRWENGTEIPKHVTQLLFVLKWVESRFGDNLRRAVVSYLLEQK
jgi:DNA-binding transcriptional regulator YiaG